MKHTIVKGLIPLLLLALISGIGCEKKPPKGAREMESSTSGVQKTQQGGVIEHEDGSIQVGPLKMTLPAGWESVPPSSSMRRAQFSIPAAEENQSGEVTVFYFGPDAGSVEANITRWMNQFQQADGQPILAEQIHREQLHVKGMPITMVSFKGTQRPSSMPGMPATGEMPGYMNISGIVLSPDGPWFFKGTGPEVTMESQLEAFKTLFNGISYVGTDH